MNNPWDAVIWSILGCVGEYGIPSCPPQSLDVEVLHPQQLVGFGDIVVVTFVRTIRNQPLAFNGKRNQEESIARPAGMNGVRRQQDSGPSIASFGPDLVYQSFSAMKQMKKL